MFIVIEIQAYAENVDTIVTKHSDRLQAESKYHEVLKYAAVSQVPKHSAVLMNDEGQRLKSETYIHDVAVEE